MATLENNLHDLATAVATEFKLDRAKIGDLASLTTSAKTSLVAALNEVAAAIGSAGASINDSTISALTVWSSSKTDGELDSRISSAISALIGAAPAELDTLAEIAAALGDDDDLAGTLTSAIALKADKTYVDNTFVTLAAVGDTDADFVQTFQDALE